VEPLVANEVRQATAAGITTVPTSQQTKLIAFPTKPPFWKPKSLPSIHV
jgi:hypothetical protein